MTAYTLLNKAWGTFILINRYTISEYLNINAYVTRHACEFIQAVKRSSSTFPHFANSVTKDCTRSTIYTDGRLTGSMQKWKVESGLEENKGGEATTVGKTWREVKAIACKP